MGDAPIKETRDGFLFSTKCTLIGHSLRENCHKWTKIYGGAFGTCQFSTDKQFAKFSDN